MSIVRIGLAETKDFADGYDAIFGKKPIAPEKAKAETEPKSEPKPDAAKPNAPDK